MVLVLPKVKSFGESFGESIGSGFGQGMEAGLQAKKLRGELERENQEIEAATGIKMPNINDPKLRQEYFAKKLQQKHEREQDKMLLDEGNDQGEEMVQEGLDYTKRPEEKLVALLCSKRHA